MLAKLEEDRTKIPYPNFFEIISMFTQANASLTLDTISAFKPA